MEKGNRTQLSRPLLEKELNNESNGCIMSNNGGDELNPSQQP